MFKVNDVVKIKNGTDMWVIHTIRLGVARIGFLKGGPIVTVGLTELEKVINE